MGYIRNTYQASRVWIYQHTPRPLLQAGKWLWRKCLTRLLLQIRKGLWKLLTQPPVQIVGLILIYLGVVGFNFSLDWFSFPDLSPEIWIDNRIPITPKDLITYKLNYRDARFKALSGLAVLIGLWIAYHRLQTANEEQMTNRFAKAVELLANKDTSVRLGALYALERIANDSDKDYPAIIETIAAYVRSRAPWPAPAPESQEEADNIAQSQEPSEEVADTTQKPEPKVKEDISAAIHILGRRKKLEHPQIFLNDTDLSGLKLTAKCDFSKANFQNARLSHANLRQANLEGAHLEGAHLEGAYLEGAYLTEADLEAGITQSS